MHTKRLGSSDLFITPIGFGAWVIGGSGWAFAWVLHNPAVTGATVGARRPGQVRGVVGAADLRLSTRDLSEIGAFFTREAA
jgi:aryl-alcohol dehydrogenase-like predicted oxidoreductase